GEDQRDVDADALRDRLGGRLQVLEGGRDIDVGVGAVDHPPQVPGLGDGLGRVLGYPRVDLDRHPAVEAAGLVVDRAQHVTCPADVVGGDGAGRLFHAHAANLQVLDLLVVGVALGYPLE